ncbi:hypothetical protein NPIL_239251, partial [Nephila pilipes]
MREEHGFIVASKLPEASFRYGPRDVPDLDTPSLKACTSRQQRTWVATALGTVLRWVKRDKAHATVGPR